MNVEYRRITRRRRTPAGSSELWLANDHLLLVARHWCTERYSRFRLNEIQSILIVERPSVRGIQIIGVAAVAALLALALFGQLTAAQRALAGIPLFILLVFQLVDLFRGPYGRVELATAVSTVRLPPLSRMRTAAQFLDTVTPLIEAAQGQWTPAPVPAELEWGISGPSTPPLLPPPLPSQRRSQSKTMETILFLATLLVGVYAVFSRHIPVPTAVWTLSWGLAAIPVVLGGIVAFGGRGGWERVLAGTASASCIVLGFSSAVRYFSVISNAAKSGLDPYQALARHNLQSPAGDALGVTVALIGLIGLILTRGRAT